MVRKALRRLWQRPRPLILLYLMVSVPAPFFAVLFEAAVAPLSRYPALRTAIARHSLDAWLELITMFPRQMPQGMQHSFWTIGIGLCGLLLVLPLWPFARLFLEGGILYSYAAETKPDRRAFFRAGRHYFGLFTRLYLLEIGLVIVLSVPLAGIGYAASRLDPVAGKVAGRVGVALVLLLLFIIEMARTLAVVEGTDRVGAALKASLRFLRRRGGAFLLIVLLWGLGFGLLRLAWRHLAAHLTDAWLPILLAGQAHLVLRLLLYLWRRAMEIIAAEPYLSEARE